MIGIGRLARSWLCLALVAPPAWAQAGPEPVQVSVWAAVADVTHIEGKDQIVGIDLLMRLTWNDPEMAHAGPREIGRRLGEVWHPEVQIVYGANLKMVRPEFVNVAPDGTVVYKQRFVGPLSQRFDFSDFHRDRHTIRIGLISARVASEVELVVDPRSGRLGDFSIPDWVIGDGVARAEPAVLFGDTHATVQLELEATRLTEFYLWKVIVPLAMVVFMSWSVFWISPRQVGPQIGLSATSILTLIAYRFALGQTVPALPYLTRLDKFIFAASVLVLLALVEVIVTTRWAEADRLASAEKLDRLCRWLFPLLFAVVVVGSFSG